MEALAIVLVAAVSALIFLTTWVSVRNDGGRNPLAGRAQLEAYREILRLKVERAAQERWDEAMVTRVTQELASVEAKLAEL